MSRKKKTWFIYFICLGLAIALSKFTPQVVVSPQVTRPSTELRGVWLTNVASSVMFVPWGIERAIHQLAQLNFNTVYPVVWNRGQTFYPSSVAKRVTGRSQNLMLGVLRLGQDVLLSIVKQGHREGLRVIPWFEYGFMAPANSELVRRHPDWLTVRRNNTKTLKANLNEQDVPKTGKSKVQPSFQKVRQSISNQFVFKGVWLNPLHPVVQQFILDLIVEVVTQYDVAGIQLDDHFGLPVEFGYDSFTIGLYQQEHQGKSPPSDFLDSKWMRWRADKITKFMQRVFQTVKSIKPDCLVTLSPNPQDFAYRAYLQDWQTWVQRGLVEELICQVYRDDIKTFLAQLQQPALALARRKIPVGVGITTGSLNHPVAIAQIQQQVKLVRDRGFDGVSFFYWESLWGYIAPESPRERRAIFQALFSPPNKTQNFAGIN